MDCVEQHRVALSMEPSLEEGVTVGRKVTFTVRAECRCGRDLVGRWVAVSIDGEEPIRSPLLERTAEVRFNETGPLVATAPVTAGLHACALKFEGGEEHEACSTSLAFECLPVETSLAVWDAPSPAVSGQSLTLKVGAKSSAGINLGGLEVQICDEAGAVLVSGRLGHSPLESTAALYWTEVRLTAPAPQPVVNWSARFAAADVELPHAQGELQFSFAVIAALEHTVVVTFIDEVTKQAISKAHICLGPFRGVTDETGAATLCVAKGRHELAVWHVRYEADPISVEIDADLTLHVHGKTVPDPDPATVYWSS